MTPRATADFLSQRQRDALMNLEVAGFGKKYILKRMEEQHGVVPTDRQYKYWKAKAKKQAEKASAERRAEIYDKSFAVREERLALLIRRAEEAAALEWTTPADYKRINSELRALLEQVARELHEWQTGDTYNILINVMTPVVEELIRWAVRHMPEGELRVAALADLGRITKTHLEALPDVKTIKGKAKQIKKEG